MKLFVFLLASIISAAVAGTYNGYETPDYTVLEENDGYELRSYGVTKWAATSMNGAVFKQVQSNMFWKLFGYIGGANSDSLKIKMTTPVITKFPTRPCAFCNNTYTMMFFMSPSKPSPAPTGDEISLVDLEEMQVYVKTFGGFANGNEWQTEASKLHGLLNADGISDSDLNLDLFYAVGYDGPMRFFKRRNEVWILKV